jgi:hypothetical protein
MDFANPPQNETCNLVQVYFEEEFYCYLFIMCPLAIIGIILNLISLKVFKDKSFNSVTFRYLRLITFTDFFICVIIIPYCLTSYTQPYNKYDLFARHFYLAYVYIPGANLAINLSMLLNLLVTIERLISVGWPTQKYTLFKPSRYYLSCFLVCTIAIVLNIANFFLYKIEFCKTLLVPRMFTMQKWWTVYCYVKEVLTRILPIIILIIVNIMLVYIVRSSRERMKESTSVGLVNKKQLRGPKLNSKTQNNNNNVYGKRNGNNIFSSNCLKSCFVRDRSSILFNEENLELNGGQSKKQSLLVPNASSATLSSVKQQQLPTFVMLNQTKKNRQENQLTIMTIFVAILYLVTRYFQREFFKIIVMAFFRKLCRN